MSDQDVRWGHHWDGQIGCLEGVLGGGGGGILGTKDQYLPAGNFSNIFISSNINLKRLIKKVQKKLSVSASVSLSVCLYLSLSLSLSPSLFISIYPYVTYLRSLGLIEYLICLITEYPIWLEFTLPYISRGLLFSSVNLISMYKNSDWSVFKRINFFGEISTNWPDDLSGANVYKLLNFININCW